MKLIPVSLTQFVGRQTLTLQKNSPGILFAGGLAGVLAGTVLACRSTLKVEAKLDDLKKDVDKVKSGVDNDPKSRPYSREEDGKELVKVYATHGFRIFKLYAPGLACTVIGVGFLTKSHNTLQQRNAALAAAYGVVSEAFEAYRVRVRQEVGEEKEAELYRGLRLEPTDPTDSNSPACMVDTGLSMYARWFDQQSSSYHPNGTLNLMFVGGVERYLNDRLTAKGYVFLNEAYRELGLPECSYGQIVGWTKKTDGVGDGHISFNMEGIKTQLLLTDEPSFVIDFNVDGPMYTEVDELAHPTRFNWGQL